MLEIRNNLKLKTLILFIGVNLSFVSTSAANGGPWVVDDAGIVDLDTLQIESWFSYISSRKRLANVTPAYQIAPSLELSVPFEIYWDNSQELISAGIEAKYVFYEFESYAVSAVVGTGNSISNAQLDEIYGYIPFTFSVLENISSNINLGWVHDYREGDNYLSWGASASYELVSHRFIIGEIFGLHSGKAGWQSGLRWELIDSSAVLDLIYGHYATTNAKGSLTAGVTLLF